jgi:hypothetical protein
MGNAGPVSTLEKVSQGFGRKQEGFVIYFTKSLVSSSTGSRPEKMLDPCRRALTLARSFITEAN